MKWIYLIIVLACASPALGKECSDALSQSRELRVKATDEGYRLDLEYNGQWRTLLTARGQIILPRFALERAEVAFLVEFGEKWSVELLSLDGRGYSLGELNKKPVEMCYDNLERQLLLVSGSGAVTPLALPNY